MRHRPTDSRSNVIVRLAGLMLVLSIVISCGGDRAVVARVGAARITVGAIKRRFATLGKDEQQYYAANVRQLVEQEIRREAFLQEARRRGLAAHVGKQRDGDEDALLAALAGELQAEATRSVPDTGVTDDEIQRAYADELKQPDRRFTYFPERFQVMAMIFEDLSDARAAARAVRALPSPTAEGFRSIYSTHARPLLARGKHPESWDFFLMKEDDRLAALWAPAAAAQVGDVVGPVANDGRYYVVKLLDHITEVGTLAEVKTMVVTSLLQSKRQQALQAAEERVASAVPGAIDEKVLAKLVLGEPGAGSPAPPPETPAPVAPPVAGGSAPAPPPPAAAAGRPRYEPHPDPPNPPSTADVLKAIERRNQGIAMEGSQ